MKNLDHEEYKAWTGRPVQESLLDLIDQLIDRINELEKTCPPHEHRDLSRGGPAVAVFDVFAL